MNYNAYIVCACVAGVLLSIYAYNVEITAERDKEYKAMCDISEHMSCTKVFTSEFGKGFGIVEKTLGKDSKFNLPNGLLGSVFYAFIGLLCMTNNRKFVYLQFILSFISVLFSLRLAYILYFILYDFCVVCVSTYVVNIINTVFSYLKMKEISRRSSKKSSKEKILEKKSS